MVVGLPGIGGHHRIGSKYAQSDETAPGCLVFRDIVVQARVYSEDSTLCWKVESSSGEVESSQL